jgi:GNAT superfamily N-acetyltransferase
VSGLDWTPTSSLKEWDHERLENIRKLITETTGEAYRIDRLRELPLDENFGRWVLSDGDSDLGILWIMRMSESCARVLAFSVTENLQGNGIGADGWRHFALAAKASGIRSVQLEVRQDNFAAIRMYHRRGLRPKGCISGFYRGRDGWLMLGPLQADVASQ